MTVLFGDCLSSNSTVHCVHLLGLETATLSQWKLNPQRTTCFPTWIQSSSSSRVTSQAVCRGSGTTACYSSRSPPLPWPGSSSCSSPTRTACSLRSTQSLRPRWTRQDHPGYQVSVGCAQCTPTPDKSSGWHGDRQDVFSFNTPLVSVPYSQIWHSRNGFLTIF